MSEEIKDPRVNVPRAMIAGIIINGCLGFGMLLTVLFCAGDLTAAFGSPTGFPFLEIMVQATGSIGGTSTMAAVIVIIAFVATIGTSTAASRQLWAFSRDRGVPGWSVLSKV
jgi:choline transport protein